MNKTCIDKLLREYATPMYVFDTGELRRRVAYLKSRLPESVSLCYAVKANTFISADIADTVERFEVCSPGELEICRGMGIDTKKLVISGVYKTPSVMEHLAASAEVAFYTAESVLQFELLSDIANRLRVRLPIMLRLTSGSQFGMNASEITEILRNHGNDRYTDIKSIQYFSGTQKTSLKRMKRELDTVDAFMESLEAETGVRIGELEFGPGFPVSYFRNDDFDEEEYLKGFSELISGMRFGGKLILELGRSIAASCGCYLTSVVDTKTNMNENYIITDGGMHQLVYYGQSMAMRLPHVTMYGGDGGAELPWSVCGSLCTVNDILVKQLPLAGVRTGAVLAFENTGAYCMTEGISLFLSRDLPRVILISPDGVPKQVRDSVQTYIYNQPEIRKETKV